VFEFFLGAVFGAIAIGGFIALFRKREPAERPKTELDVLRSAILADDQLPLSVTEQNLNLWIALYVNHIELTPTDDICRCVWQIHPDDKGKPKGQRRKRRVDNHPFCPVHTKEGLIKGFVEWTNKNEYAD
jgi:hypothetical protein